MHAVNSLTLGFALCYTVAVCELLASHMFSDLHKNIIGGILNLVVSSSALKEIHACSQKACIKGNHYKIH